ncbi:MAG TPA: hypothetical protein VGQ41_16205 [Pyrinomonadaceae bacterium]|nr:hypothetical protein [Pyrinomonadaceae bacterium]
MRLTHFSRYWHIYLHDEYVQPDYRSQAGFIRRTNYHASTVDVGYEWRPREKSNLSKFLVYVWAYFILNRSFTLDGKPEINYADPSVEFVFKRGVQVNSYTSFHHDGFADKEFHYKLHYVSWSVGSFKRFSFSGRVSWGEGINLDPANPDVGNALSTQQTLTLRPTNRLNSEFLYLKSQLRHQVSNARFFNQDIIRNRTIYQLSRSQALRSLVEYDTAQRQTGLSFLYSYTPSPNTALYFAITTCCSMVWTHLIVGAYPAFSGSNVHSSQNSVTICASESQAVDHVVIAAHRVPPMQLGGSRVCRLR